MGSRRTKAQRKRFMEKKRLRDRQIGRVIGLLNSLTGEITEQQFFGAFESAELPPWLHKIRKANKKLDQRGVDAIAETDAGLFYIQIKSSVTRALTFMRDPRHKGIGVVVTYRKDTPEFIRHHTLEVVSQARKEALTAKSN